MSPSLPSPKGDWFFGLVKNQSPDITWYITYWEYDITWYITYWEYDE